jgi:hypothetical protein
LVNPTFACFTSTKLHILTTLPRLPESTSVASRDFSLTSRDYTRTPAQDAALGIFEQERQEEDRGQNALRDRDDLGAGTEGAEEQESKAERDTPIGGVGGGQVRGALGEARFVETQAMLTGTKVLASLVQRYKY